MSNNRISLAEIKLSCCYFVENSTNNLLLRKHHLQTTYCNFRSEMDSIRWSNGSTDTITGTCACKQRILQQINDIHLVRLESIEEDYFASPVSFTVKEDKVLKIALELKKSKKNCIENELLSRIW